LKEGIELTYVTVHPRRPFKSPGKWLVVKATSEVYEYDLRLRALTASIRWFLVPGRALLD